MPTPDERPVWVLTASPTGQAPPGRPVSVRGISGHPGLSSIPMTEFRQGMAGFMDAVRALVADVEERAGTFTIEQIEVAASIGADGKIAFLGSGVGVETTASFTVTLRKHDGSVAPGTVGN